MESTINITPLPPKIGYGFTSPTPLPQEFTQGYKYIPTGRFHNFFATTKNWDWPTPWEPQNNTLDGFSPNLNKQLHCGHLKNLAVARALQGILCSGPKGKSVAMLGASLGIHEGALPTYQLWCHLAKYSPVIYFDNKLPEPDVILEEGTGEYEGCKMLGDVVIYRSNGNPTYAAHDLAFAEVVRPDFYLTGAEQKQHFDSIGLKDKYIPLGLVLGADGRKMRSSIKKEGEEANALSAQELFNMVLDCLEPSPEPEKLAWNILSWQFNSAQIATNTKFVPEQWAKPESPGLYCSYTLARIGKALSAATSLPFHQPKIEEEDVPLLAESQYLNHAINKAQQAKEPLHLANYVLTLSRTLSNRYKARSISEGTPSYQWSIQTGFKSLATAMTLLGMHPLKEV